MSGAHECQLVLVRSEINDQHVELNIILVHAQDHLIIATIARDLAEESIRLYACLDKKEYKQRNH